MSVRSAPQTIRRLLRPVLRPTPTVLALVAAGSATYAATLALPPKVDGMAVRRTVFHETVHGVGRLTADRRAMASASVQSLVLELPARPGTTVAGGDVIAVLDARAVEAEVRTARARADAAARTVEAAEVGHAKAVAAARQAAARLRRVASLARSGHATEAEHDTARTEAEAADLDVLAAAATRAGAAADHASALAAVEEAASRLADHTLRAPFDGLVTSVPASVEARVAPGSALVEVADPETLAVDVRLDETSLAKVAPGASATVRVMATGETIPAEVATVDRALDDETREGRVRLRLETTPEAWALGQRVTASIVVAAIPDATVAPLVALGWRNGEPFVLAARDGRARRVPVTVLGYGETAVRLRGIEPGATLVEPGSVAPGRRVEVAR